MTEDEDFLHSPSRCSGSRVKKVSGVLGPTLFTPLHPCPSILYIASVTDYNPKCMPPAHTKTPPQP